VVAVTVDSNGEPPIPSPDVLLTLLLLALKRGAQASNLLRHVPDLVDALCPERRFPVLDLSARAFEAEREIRAAIQTFDDCMAGFYTVAFGLDTTRRVSATMRLTTAGVNYLGVSNRTVTTKARKEEYFLPLAFALYERLRQHYES
jgi:hypothetical protein